MIKRLEYFEGLDVVLYTKIAATIEPLTAIELARRAIASAKAVDDGRDGITYLIDAMKNGISTRLTLDYEREILRQTGAETLDTALSAARGG